MIAVAAGWTTTATPFVLGLGIGVIVMIVLGAIAGRR